MTRKLTILAFFLSLNIGFAQDFSITKLTLEDYLSDLKTLDHIIQKQHPNPYQFLSEKEQNKRKKVNIKKLKKNPSFENFLKCLNRFGDGHVYYSTSKIKQEYANYLKNNHTFFPIPVVLRDGRMFVNIKGDVLPYGTEIISIQKKPVKEILETLNQYVSMDGYVMSSTEAAYRNFIIDYSLFIGNNAHEFEITYLSNVVNTPKKVILKGIDIYEVTRKNKLTIQPLNRFEFEEFNMDLHHFNDNIDLSYFDNMHDIDLRYSKNKKIGVLTVNSFMIGESEAYKKFSEFFKTVNKEHYKNIIIDIRNNGGGITNIAELLFSFIMDKNLKNEFNYRTKTIKIEKENLLTPVLEDPASDEYVSNVENWLYQGFNKAEDGYIGNGEEMKKIRPLGMPKGIISPDKDNYKGNVFLIVGGNTFSAAAYFTKLFKDHKRGKIIGAETGGNESFAFAVRFLFYELPKTKLVVRIPMVELHYSDTSIKSAHGVLPDIIVPTKKFIEYLRKEKDPEIEYLLETYIK